MYKIANLLMGHTSVYRELDDAWIPLDHSNSDYQQYLAWVAEGNTAEEWTPEG
jgi:hypothetical protein